MAVGLIEVFGMATAYYAADAGCKAGAVRIKAIDKNKPPNADALPVPLLVMIKFEGSVEDVKSAIEAAQKAANEIAGYETSYILSNPDEGMEAFLDISCI